MKRYAVIFESSPFDRKGLFNAVHNRILHLSRTGECTVDAYCIHSRDNALTRRLRHTSEVPDVEEVNEDGIRYRILWYRFSISDHLMVNKLHIHPVFFMNFINKVVPCLATYDAVLAHSFSGALMAWHNYLKNGTPFYVTWHGSDIHTHPWRNPMILDDTRSIMRAAECNFFVSRALLEVSDKITDAARKEVLYNGVSNDFCRYEDERRAMLRAAHGLLEGCKTVAFVGNLVAVKNVLVLRPLFDRIRELYNGELSFWVIGDGKMRDQVEDSLKGLDVRFFGNVVASDMPDLMNCIDVLVLPSVNEGLPLVCLEAIRSGANVVGADTGGIPEAIGAANVFPLGDALVEGMANRAVQMLQGNVKQTVPSKMDWEVTAARESEIIFGTSSR